MGTDGDASNVLLYRGANVEQMRLWLRVRIDRVDTQVPVRETLLEIGRETFAPVLWWFREGGILDLLGRSFVFWSLLIHSCYIDALMLYY